MSFNSRKMRNELAELARSLTTAGGFGMTDGCYYLLDTMLNDAEETINNEPHRRLELTFNFTRLIMSMMEKADKEHQPELHEPFIDYAKVALCPIFPFCEGEYEMRDGRAYPKQIQSS